MLGSRLVAQRSSCRPCRGPSALVAECVEGRFREPRRGCIAAPGAEVFSHRLVSNEFFTRFSIFDLQAQSHVEHSAAAAREAVHAQLLPAVWPQFVLEGLLDLHYANS